MLEESSHYLMWQKKWHGCLLLHLLLVVKQRNIIASCIFAQHGGTKLSSHYLPEQSSCSKHCPEEDVQVHVRKNNRSRHPCTYFAAVDKLSGPNIGL